MTEFALLNAEDAKLDVLADKEAVSETGTGFGTGRVLGAPLLWAFFARSAYDRGAEVDAISHALFKADRYDLVKCDATKQKSTRTVELSVQNRSSTRLVEPKHTIPKCANDTG